MTSDQVVFVVLCMSSIAQLVELIIHNNDITTKESTLRYK